MVTIFNPQSQFNVHICLFYVHSKLGLRGGYFCLEVISTDHHREVWAHPWILYVFLPSLNAHYLCCVCLCAANTPEQVGDLLFEWPGEE